jgi:hypothetical protein
VKVSGVYTLTPAPFSKAEGNNQRFPIIKTRYIWLAAMMFLPMSFCHAVEEWKEVKRDAENGIVVYTRKLDSGDTEFKGITHVKSSLSGCVALMRDVDAMPQWVHRTIMAKVLYRVSDTEVYAYNISRTERPLNDRDVIVHTVLGQDPDTLAITIRGKGLEQYGGESWYDYKANEHQYVRMPKVESFWRFEPQGEGMVEVTFQGYGDPGGNVSNPFFKWFLSFVVWESPYETLKNMRGIIGRPEYQNARFHFIKEPAANNGGHE